MILRFLRRSFAVPALSKFGRLSARTKSAPENETAEAREEAFVRIVALAQKAGLHVAPSVPLDTVFSIRDGRSGGLPGGAGHNLAHDRVDVLLLDNFGCPVLAVDHDYGSARTRNDRRQTRAKSRLFERAGLPYIALASAAEWTADRVRIEHHLAALSRRSTAQRG
ncbi:MAG: DUF2726 domain-containing protein [Jannaschia sp.]